MYFVKSWYLYSKHAGLHEMSHQVDQPYTLPSITKHEACSENSLTIKWKNYGR